jgi:hypothetical protein
MNLVMLLSDHKLQVTSFFILISFKRCSRSSFSSSSSSSCNFLAIVFTGELFMILHVYVLLGGNYLIFLTDTFAARDLLHSLVVEVESNNTLTVSILVQALGWQCYIERAAHDLHSLFKHSALHMTNTQTCHSKIMAGAEG